MNIAGLTPIRLLGAILVGLAIAGAFTYATAPHPVITPVQTITPVPTPPPVIIQPTSGYFVYGGAGGAGGTGYVSAPVVTPVATPTVDPDLAAAMQAFNIIAIVLIMIGVALMIGGVLFVGRVR